MHPTEATVATWAEPQRPLQVRNVTVRERGLVIVDLFYIDFFTYLMLVAHFLVSTMNLQRLQQSGFCLATSGYMLKHLSCFDEVCDNDACHSFPNTHTSVVVFHLCFSSVSTLFLFGAWKCWIFPWKGVQESNSAQHKGSKTQRHWTHSYNL